MPSSLDNAIERIGNSLKVVHKQMIGDSGPATLLGNLGWQVPPGGGDIGLAALDLGALVDAIETLNVGISAGAGGVTLAGDYAALFEEVTKIFGALDGIASGFAAGGDYLAKTDIKNQFVDRLLDYVVVQALSDGSLLSIGFLMFTGILERQPYDRDDSIYQTQHTRDVIHWDRIPKLFGDMPTLLKSVYLWGTAGFNADAVVTALGGLLMGISLPSRVRALPRRAESLISGHDVPLADTNPSTQLLLSVVRSFDDVPVDVGLSLIALRPSAPGGTDGGLAIVPYAHGGGAKTVPLSDTVNFVIDATLDVQTGLAFVIRAGSPPKIVSNLTSASAVASALDGHLTFSLAYTPAGGGAAPILTLTDGIGIEAKSMSLGGGADISGGVLNPMVVAGIKGGRFYVDGSQMDSFLASLIPISLSVDFDFGLGWSASNGFFFQGNASTALTIPLHVSAGPFDLDTMHVELDNAGGNTLPLEVSLTGSGSIGPFKVSVDRIGLKLTVAFQRGNLGPLDFGLEFKPPNGLGMELDAGLISGGGYLSIDTAKHRYAGVLECSIADVVQVKIIGVLDTVMPDGSNGFSLLLVITTEFPPVQLSFGFTLNGVGGIGGINRTMALDALRAGLRAHQLNSILFPSDPVDNAPQIISNLSSFFPPANGRYLFGPMFELGWGTPTLITLALGVILEIPDPIRLAILGEIKAALPDQDVALIALNIDVLGTVDFGIKLFTIDGTMYDSYVLVYSISGDLGMRLSWGDNPNFAFSLGGLNPRFTPPPGFPQLARCTVSIGDGDNPRLSSTSYFAVTSNSVQFGANVDLYAAAGGFSVHGWIGFDCLFIFEPFSFEFDFSAGLDIEYDGDSIASLQVDGMVSGPHQWHVHGDASFHILFIDVSASVDLSWGDTDPVVLPAAKVLDDLLPALGDQQNWSTLLPAESAPSVSLTPRAPGDKTLVVHPLGTLQVREKVVPLDQVISKYGNARPSDGTEFAISDVAIGTTHPTVASITEQFAIGQFTDLTNDQKLSLPSYQPMDAGVTIGADTAAYSRDVPCIVAYQDAYLDDDNLPARLGSWYLMPLETHLAYARNGASFRNATRSKGVRAFTRPGYDQRGDGWGDAVRGRQRDRSLRALRRSLRACDALRGDNRAGSVSRRQSGRRARRSDNLGQRGRRLMDYGRYHFLPWLRRGVGAAIPNADVDPLPARAKLDVVLTVSSTLAGVVTTSNPPDTTVGLYGPGDIIGIDPNVIIRTEPRPSTSNYEPNYLAGIDFSVADLPWMFTPAANTGDRLRPWLALIALKNGEFKEAVPQTVPLPSIGVTTISALQDLSESWAWAHVQVSNEDDVAATLANDPGHVLSRLICPRRLEPETSYDVFLVPAFDIGRQAGLGLDISAITTSAPSWTSATPASPAAPFALPYYYRFAFHTSDEGDFESLVRRLVPQVLPPAVGIRPVAVDQPGPHMASAGTPLGLEGALIRVGTTPTEWDDPAKAAFQTALETLVNLTTSTIDDPAHPNADDPRVVPPIYGRWHAGVAKVDRTQSGWLNELNLDPRNRIPGGFGSEVVQTKRTTLLASAWQQVAGVIEANRLLRQAQLARATMVQLYNNHLRPSGGHDRAALYRADSRTYSRQSADGARRRASEPHSVAYVQRDVPACHASTRAAAAAPRRRTRERRDAAHRRERRHAHDRAAGETSGRNGRPRSGLRSAPAVFLAGAAAVAADTDRSAGCALARRGVGGVRRLGCGARTGGNRRDRAYRRRSRRACRTAARILRRDVSHCESHREQLHQRSAPAGLCGDRAGRAGGDGRAERQFRFGARQRVPHRGEFFQRFSERGATGRCDTAVARHRRDQHDRADADRSGRHDPETARDGDRCFAAGLEAAGSDPADHGGTLVRHADVCAAARPLAVVYPARGGANSAQQSRSAANKSRVHRSLHGRPQSRDGAPTARQRLSDRSARQLLPAVLGRQPIRAAAG